MRFNFSDVRTACSDKLAHTFVTTIIIGNPITMVNTILSVLILMNVMPMTASTMPVISSLSVLTMMDLMFVSVTSVRS